MKYTIEAGAVSDKGIVKQVNQDSILVQIGEHNGGDFGLFIVCDGLGGLTQGEIASRKTVNNFKQWWNDKIEIFINEYEPQKIIDSLCEIVRKSNEEIIKYSNEIGSRVGTTISALLILKDNYYIVHVGDSRIYSINKKFNKLTEDHSYVAMKVKKGEITWDEARKSKERNILLQCVGVKEKLDIFTTVGKIKGNENFCICCDGFYNTMEEEKIIIAIKKLKNKTSSNLTDLSKSLVEEIKRKGERDNISIILVSLKLKEKRSFISKMFNR